MTDQEILEKYMQEKEGHNAFRLKDGTYYEGYILEVYQDSILFGPMPSPMNDVETWRKAIAGELDIVIPIQAINMSTLYW